MTDQIRIKEATSGKLIALRTAAEQHSGEDRYIQGVDLCSRPLSLTLLRTVSSADSADLSSFPGALTALSLTDEALAVCQLYHSSSVGVAQITPVAVVGSQLVIYETKESGIGAAWSPTDGTDYLSPILAWDVLGAEAVYFLATSLSPGNTVKIYGGVI